MGSYSDSFAQGDENPLSSNGVWSGGYTGFGNLQVIGHRIRSAGLNSDERMTYNAASFADQFAQVTIKTWNTSAADTIATHLLLRWTPEATATGYECVVVRSGGVDAIHVYKITAGTEVELGTGQSITIAANDVLKCTMVGSLISVFQNDILRYTTSDPTTNSGRVGMGGFVGPTGSLADVEVGNFIGGDFGINVAWLIS